MNPAEQHARRDALRQARAEIHQQYQEFEHRVQNAVQALEARHLRDIRRLRDELQIARAEAVSRAAALTERTTRVLRADFLSRWLWLLTGREIGLGSVNKSNGQRIDVDKGKNTGA